MSVKKLNKSQKKLVASWNKELSNEVQKFQQTATSLAQAFAASCNEIFNGRLELLARTELDIDLDDGKWEYSGERAEFIKNEEVKEVIPSGKTNRPKKTSKKDN